MTLRFVTAKKLAELTGYSVDALKQKIQRRELSGGLSLFQVPR